MITGNLDTSHSAHGKLENKSVDTVEWVHRFRFLCGKLPKARTCVLEQLRKALGQCWTFHSSGQTLGEVVAEAIDLVLSLRKRVVSLLVDCWASTKHGPIAFRESQVLGFEEEASGLVARHADDRLVASEEAEVACRRVRHLPLEEFPSLGEELHGSDDWPCFSDHGRRILRKRWSFERVQESSGKNGNRQKCNTQQRVVKPKIRLERHGCVGDGSYHRCR
jgi:hypothetical protein